MDPRQRRIALGFVLLFGFCARAATYRSPLLDHHAWRQADTASIARNFYRERFNILYPQIDWRGRQATGYVETGLELPAFLVAAVSTVVGFHTETGRLLSSIAFLASCWLVWSFVGRRYGEEWGLAGAFLYAFGFPSVLFIEHAFMNEAVLLCLSLCTLVAAQRYLDHPGAGRLLALVAAPALLGAIKVPYLVIWAPLIGLFVERFGFSAWKRWELWLVGGVSLAAAAAWYTHAHALGQATGLSFGLLDKTFDAHVVFSWDFVKKIGVRLLKDHLGPVGLAATLVGTWYAWRRHRWCELFGVAGFIAYLLIVARGNMAHDYYQLPLMPIAPAVIALGLSEGTSRWLAGATSGRRETVLAALLAVAALSTFVRLSSAHSWLDYGPEDVVLCNAAAAIGQPDDRAVIVGEMDPKLLFCSDRKGWVLAPAESDIDHLRSAWRDGARLVFIQKSFTEPQVREFLNSTGTRVLSSDVREVFQLRPAR
jgi:hypothetical protein